MSKLKQTDWDMYYAKPASASSFTRNITEKMILNTLHEFCGEKGIAAICELGGANSCFYKAIRENYPDVMYTIIDNNTKGLELFAKLHKNDVSYKLLNQNLLSISNYPENNDVVYSVGLIEHFNEKQTAEIIKTHFRCAKEGALVLITFPTPTVLYRVVRRLAELLGLWVFHDERPLLVENVVKEVEKYGTVQKSFINWGVILTQGVVIVKVNSFGQLARDIITGEV